MVKFIPIRYSDTINPPDINPKIQERAANFFRKTLEKTKLPYLSLHTDPARRWNKEKILSSDLLAQYPAILNNAYEFGQSWISKLWYDEQWSKDFSGFLVKLVDGMDRQRIRLIEVHPPFNDYCDSFETFIERYKPFEEEILKEFPEAIINIENRCNRGKKYIGGKFLLSSNIDIIKLSKLICDAGVKLKIVLDFPQLFTEHYEQESLSSKMIKEVLAPIKEIRDCISSAHIWGKGKEGVHNGDLDIYFNNDKEVKDCFLQEVWDLFNDGKERYFVPEVDSTPHIKSIVSDLRNAGFEFVEFRSKGEM